MAASRCIKRGCSESPMGPLRHTRSVEAKPNGGCCAIPLRPSPPLYCGYPRHTIAAPPAIPLGVVQNYLPFFLQTSIFLVIFATSSLQKRKLTCRSGWVGPNLLKSVYLTLCLLTLRNLAVPKQLVKNKAAVDAHGYVL